MMWAYGIEFNAMRLSMKSLLTLLQKTLLRWAKWLTEAGRPTTSNARSQLIEACTEVDRQMSRLII